MDLRGYYRKIRETVEQLPTDIVIVSSKETPDGGRPGVLTEVRREQAARLLVDGRARLATTDEAEQYRESVRMARDEVERAEQQSRVQVTVLNDADLKALRQATKARV